MKEKEPVVEDLVNEYRRGKVVKTDMGGFKEIAKANEIEILKQRISRLRNVENPILPESIYYGIWRERETYAKEYGISWEELGISEQEFTDLCKQAMKRGVHDSMEQYRKKVHHPTMAPKFISKMKEIISSGFMSYEELGITEEELAGIVDK